MEHYAAIDVSLEWSSVCVVDASGEIVREASYPITVSATRSRRGDARIG